MGRGLIEVDGVTCRVAEDLGWQMSAGVYAKESLRPTIPAALWAGVG